MKPVRFPAFLGINNKLPATSLSVEAGRYLADAVNVDIDNDGSLRRRIATERVAAVTGVHSLFDGLAVLSSALYSVSLPGGSMALSRVLESNARMSYTEVADGRLFLSNGTDSLRRTAAGAIVPWALPAPSAPTLAEIPGSLSLGRYRVALSFSDAEHEGALSEMALIEASGVRVTLPTAPEGATHVNIYITGNDGDVPMLHTSQPVGDASIDLATPADGQQSIREHEAPLPAGNRIFEFNGRLCSVSGNRLYFSQPYRYGYYRPASGVIPFPADITCAAGAQDGIYVATATHTYYIAGRDLDSPDVAFRTVGKFGAVPGTEFEHPDNPVFGWFSTKGFAILNPGGEVALPMSSAVDVGSLPESGASVVLTTDRRDRVISCGWCLSLGNGAATRYEDFDFTSFHGGFATAPDGFHSIGALDEVPYSVDFGLEDFGTSAEKRMPAIYLGAQCGDALTIRIGAKNESYDYQARSFSPDSLDIHRVDPGKGIRDNWFRISLIGDDGADFTLASVEFAPVASNRRI